MDENNKNRPRGYLGKTLFFMSKTGAFFGGIAAILSAIIVAIVMLYIDSNQTEKVEDNANLAPDISKEHSGLAKNMSLIDYDLHMSRAQCYLAQQHYVRSLNTFYEAAELSKDIGIPIDSIIPFYIKAIERTFPLVFHISDNPDPIVALAFSKDIRFLAIGSVKNVIRVWDLAQKRIVSEISLKRSVRGLEFYQGSKYLLAIGFGSRDISIIDVRRNRIEAYLKGHGKAVRGIAMRSDERVLFSCGNDKRILVWDLIERKLTKELCKQEEVISCIATNTNGSIVSFMTPKNCYAWDTKSNTELFRSKRRGPTYSCSINSESTYLAYSNMQNIDIVDLRSNRLIGTMKGHSDFITSIEFYPESDLLISSCLNGKVKLWAVDDLREVATICSQTKEVLCTDIDRQGGILATGGKSKTVDLWDVTLEKYSKAIPTDKGINCAALLGNNNLLAFSSGNGVGIYDYASDKLITSFVVSKSFVSDMAWVRPNEYLIASDGNGAIHVWDIDGFAKKKVISLHKGNIWDIDVHPTKPYVVSSGGDNLIKITNVQSGSELLSLSGHTTRARAVAFCTDSNMLASGGDDNKVVIWEYENGEKLNEICDFESNIMYLQFSPNGRCLYIAEIYKVHIWNINTEKIETTFEIPIRKISFMSINSVGDMLILGSSDGRILYYDLNRKKEIGEVREHMSTVTWLMYNERNDTFISTDRDGWIIIRDVGKAKRHLEKELTNRRE